jgi:hypothetical protein
MKKIKVNTTGTGTGILRFKSLSKPVCTNAEIRQTGDDQYEINLRKDEDYRVEYKCF